MRSKWGALTGVIGAVAVIAMAMAAYAWETRGGLRPGGFVALVLGPAATMLLVVSARQGQLAFHEAITDRARFLALANALLRPDLDIDERDLDAVRRDGRDVIRRLVAVGVPDEADEVAVTLGALEALAMRTTRRRLR